MQSDLGKLFIGGISWDTTEDRLKEYFGKYGEVLEAVIMKDRNTGRARGFGFIVFADPAVSEKVILEKHNIDGRMVEAKKAVPRDDQGTLSRSDGSVHGSPGPGRTRKIFVGGLASTVTESSFREYFEQFGSITDVVVMYDHNTQRPRGFGFITFDSEESVEQVLTKTFHELNGKMVEVKRAVPKELSPASNRSPVSGFNYGIGRVDYLGGYNPIYSPTALGGLGFTMDGRFSPLSRGRTAISPFGSSYGMGMNYELGMHGSLIGNGNFNSNLGYGRVNPYTVGSDRFGNNLDSSNIGNSHSLSSVTRNLWGNNGGLNLGAPANSRNPSVFMGSGNETIGGNTFGSNAVGWESSQNSAHGAGRTNYGNIRSGNTGYGAVDNNISLGADGYGRNFGTSVVPNSSYGLSNIAYDGADLYTGGSVYGDSTWQFLGSNRDGYGSIGNRVGASTDVAANGPSGYVGSYNVAGRQANNGPPSHGGLS